MRSGMIAFSVGVISVSYFPVLPGLASVLLLVLLNVLLSGYFRYYPLAGMNRFCFVSLCGLAGIAWHVLQAQQQLDERLPFALEGVDFLVKGRVISIPENRGTYQQFKFHIDSSANEFSDRTVILNFYGSQLILASQLWQFEIRLKRPHGLANPGTFDYEAWLHQQGITGKGYVRNSADNQLLGIAGLTAISLRGRLRARLVSLTEGLKYQFVILALTLGDRSLISGSQWQVFTRTGTNHLVVVSGLHIGLIAGLCYLLSQWFWRIATPLCLWLPAQRAGAAGAIAGALVYSMLAGFTLPTQRALIMLTVFMVARMLVIRQGPMLAFLIALVAVLLLDPFAAIMPGFWLSFSAVAALLAVFAGIPARHALPLGKRLWRQWGQAQLTVFIALAVPLMAWMGEFSLSSPLANSFAIPLVSWLVVPLCLLATLCITVVPEISLWLFGLADIAMQGIFAVLEWFAFSNSLPGMWRISFAGKTGLLFAAAATWLLILPGLSRNRFPGSVLLLGLLFPRPSIIEQNLLELHVLDVGQGLATVIRTANHVLVYDTGARFGDSFDTGTAILVPVLRQMGVNRVDRLIISHSDNDHAGGAAGLVEEIPVLEIGGSGVIPGLGVDSFQCKAGMAWEWDAVQFKILHPDNPAGLSPNNRSCVLQIRAGETALLLPGDIEAPVERQLITEYGESLDTDILVAAHHGSKTSSSQKFVATVNPRTVVFSAGYRNQFGHPAGVVQERLSGVGATLFNTASSGMLSVGIDQESPKPEVIEYRVRRARYWY